MLNRNNSGVNGVQPEKTAALTAFLVGIKALTAFNGKNSRVNGVLRVGINALTAFNSKNSGVNGVFLSVKRR